MQVHEFALTRSVGAISTCWARRFHDTVCVQYGFGNNSPSFIANLPSLPLVVFHLRQTYQANKAADYVFHRLVILYLDWPQA